MTTRRSPGAGRAVALVSITLLAGAAVATPGERGHAVGRKVSSSPITVYVGTYTDAGSRGIYRFRVDPASGVPTAPVLVAESENPSFLALSPDGRYLYAVNETDHFDAKGSGAVTSFAVDSRTGGLRFLSQQSSQGADPCHLSVDDEGRHVLVANYTGGNVAVLPVGKDGRLEPASCVRPHSGHGPRPQQKGPHAHEIVFDPTRRFVLSTDLGADRVFVYRFDPARGVLEANDPPFADVEPGSGPRHLAFDRSGRFVYTINELASTIIALSWDGKTGRLAPFQTVSTLPAGFEGENDTAEIVVSPDGRFVYGSNRGHDSLVVFRLDASSGRLSLVGEVSSGGKTPRSFAIEPSGRWLLAANKDTGTVVVFRIDPTSGLPSPVGSPVRVDKAVSVLPVASHP